MKNEGLKEVGKGLVSLSNLLLVLFLLNTYMQRDDFSLSVVLMSFYVIITLYYYGYYFINKGNENVRS